MKIVLLCGYDYPDTVGGMGTSVQMLGRGLKDAGGKITVAGPAPDNAPRSYEHSGLDTLR